MIIKHLFNTIFYGFAYHINSVIFANVVSGLISNTHPLYAYNSLRVLGLYVYSGFVFYTPTLYDANFQHVTPNPNI